MGAGSDVGPCHRSNLWTVVSYPLGYKNHAGLKKFLKDKKSILEAGCGVGRDAKIFAEANSDARIVGVDQSEEALRIAKKRWKNSLAGVSFAQISRHSKPKRNSISFRVIRLCTTHIIPEEFLIFLSVVRKTSTAILLMTSSCWEREIWSRKIFGVFSRGNGICESALRTRYQAGEIQGA